MTQALAKDLRDDPVRMEQFDRVCEQLAKGVTLRDACKEDGLPSRLTVLRWLRIQPELRAQYMAAKAEGTHVMADELLEIADDARNDWMESNDPENPGWVANHEHINRSRLRVDTRKWLMAKMLPKVYGEGLQANGGVTVQVMVVTGVPEPSTPST